MMTRAERTFFAQWWWTIDRWLLASLGVLMVLGLVLMMAASPPEAERLGLPAFFFVNRQVAFLIPAAILMTATSLLSPRHVRRAALFVFLTGIALIVLALVFGHEIKGARRWIFGIEPSEFVKPAFVVLCAWAFSEGGQRRDVPANGIAILLLVMTIGPLMLQPDFGQTMLLSIVWTALFFAAGLHWMWVGGIGGLGIGGVLVAYQFVPHVRARIEKFIDPGVNGTTQGDTFQVDTAMESFISGGWFGKGPGEGTLKRVLPDSHTDFIFAVTGEEFGIFVCLGIVAVFCFIVLRGLSSATRNEDSFCRFATAGLVMLFGIQSMINMAVNVHLMPAKGMTLPFISYGGSSLASLALTAGFLIAVTRKRPKSQIMSRVDI